MTLVASTKSDSDSNLNFWIHPDPDVRQIAPKCSGFIPLLASSHSVEFRQKWLLIV